MGCGLCGQAESDMTEVMLAAVSSGSIRHFRIRYVTYSIPVEQACFLAFFQFLELSKPSPTSVFALEILPAWTVLTLLFKWLVLLSFTFSLNVTSSKTICHL